MADLDPRHWQWSVTPSVAHVDWAESEGALFAHPLWSAALSGLGATPAFVWHPGRRLGAQLACFRKLGLRIAFLGFPTLGVGWRDLAAGDVAQQVPALQRLGGIDVLRVNRCLDPAWSPAASAGRPECWIEELQAFHAETSGRRRKDLAFARRAGPAYRMHGLTAVDGPAAHRLYADVIARHAGRIRYSADYFSALFESAGRTERVQVFGAWRGGGLAGFAVLAMDGPLAYYLHSAVDPEARRCGISDLLLAQLVAAARQAGCRQLTLMASPWDQPGLLRFKRKWSDRQGLALTFDYPGSWPGRGAVAVLRWSGRKERRLAASVLSPGQDDPA